ncbi:cyclase family protein [Arthrobacter sp. 35W]|uniref:cyclase family protein n=1 Tax=Arthrobacter sp. 35W TaxID=1132441 RepID=UPI000424ED00|nr:cyclase family protein [Arthrobacter sp. 35W]
MTTQYRASFDAKITFSNGGGLQAQGFRIDIPDRDTPSDHIGALFVASLGLLMTESVTLENVEVFAEPHKGTRGGPRGPGVAGPVPTAQKRFVELSHVIRAGETTYPGLPAPEVAPHLTREASRDVYADGTEFSIDRIPMVGNTGTYLDAPFHRYAAGLDLAGLPLAQLVDLPVVVVRTAGGGVRAVDIGQLAALEVGGCAVLLHTGGDRDWGKPSYALDAPYLTEAGAQWLVDHRAALVGIDAVNIDDTSSGRSRPAHSLLLAAGIPIVEHLTGLGAVPPNGATFTAAAPLIEAFGTFPVRAYATVPVE